MNHMKYLLIALALFGSSAWGNSGLYRCSNLAELHQADLTNADRYSDQSSYSKILGCLIAKEMNKIPAERDINKIFNILSTRDGHHPPRVDFNVVYSGRSPIMRATQLFDSSLVSLLVNYPNKEAFSDALKNESNSMRVTALDAAYMANAADIMEELKNAGFHTHF